MHRVSMHLVLLSVSWAQMVALLQYVVTRAFFLVLMLLYLNNFLQHLVEDLEERRAAGEGMTDAELAAEVAGHIVDDLSDDERDLDGGQAALMSKLNRERDEQETNDLKRAVARGTLSRMRASARRSGLSSFARNVADVDGDDDDAEAEFDEEARLAEEEEARLGEGEDVLRDEAEDNDESSGTEEGAGNNDDDHDDAFDFEAEMAARIEEHSRKHVNVSASNASSSVDFRRNLVTHNPALLASRLLGDDEDSEAMLSRLHTPRECVPSPRDGTVPVVSFVGSGQFSKPSPGGLLGGTRSNVFSRKISDPLGMLQWRQQDQIAPMRSRVSQPASGSSTSQIKPRVTVPLNTSKGSAQPRDGVVAIPDTVPLSSPPGSSPATKEEVLKFTTLLPVSHVKSSEATAGIPPGSKLTFRDSAGGCITRASIDRPSSGAVGFFAAANGGELKRVDSTSLSSIAIPGSLISGGSAATSTLSRGPLLGSGTGSVLGGATFAGSKSLLAQQQNHGIACSVNLAPSSAKAGATAGGLVSVASGKHVVFGGTDESSRSRAPNGGLHRHDSGTTSRSGSGVSFRSQVLATGGHAPISHVGAECSSQHAIGQAPAAPCSFAPALFAVLKRAPSSTSK